MSLNIGNIISSLGSSIFGNLGSEIGGIVNSPIGQAGLNLLEELAKSVFAGGSKGGPFADNIKLGPISLPDPLAKLNPMLNGLGEKITKAADLLGKLGSFLTGGMTALENGKSVSVPGLPSRSGKDAAASQNVASQIGSGAYDSALPAASAKQATGGSGAGFAATGGSGAAAGADVFGGGSLDTGLTPDQNAALKGLDEPERSRMQAQFKMQNKAELVAFISNMMKMQHDISMSVINNIR